MENLAALKAEIESLKSHLSEQEQELNKLKMFNKWYEDQLKLKAKEKFGKSSEESDPEQISLFDFGLFNEAEIFRTMSMDVNAPWSIYVLGRKKLVIFKYSKRNRLTAVLYSIVQTALANDLKPYYYLGVCIRSVTDGT